MVVKQKELLKKFKGSDNFFKTSLCKFLTKFPVLSKGGLIYMCETDRSTIFLVGYLFKKIVIIFINIIVS